MKVLGRMTLGVMLTCFGLSCRLQPGPVAGGGGRAGLSPRPVILAKSSGALPDVVLRADEALSHAVPEHETPDQRAYRFWQRTFSDFPPLGFETYTNGLATARFKAPPPPYVHPRIFFNPEDLPDLRKRLVSTRMGQAAMTSIREGIKGLPVDRQYAQLVAGKYPYVNAIGSKEQSILVMYEAFRCLIDQDKEAGRKVGTALSTLAAGIQEDFDKNGISEMQELKDLPQSIVRELPGRKDWQSSIQDRVHHQNLGLAYDFAYDFMTEAQRRVVRKCIATATAGAYAHGMGLAGPSVHNWVIFHLHHGVLALAIEGEEGYDPKVTGWSAANLLNYYTYGLYESGTPNERMGKGAIGGYLAVPYAKRGYPTVSHPNLRKAITGYALNMMEPGGYTMQVYGAWGGSGTSMAKILTDAIAVKYAFPADPVVDFVFRNCVGRDYANVSGGFSMHYAGMESLLIRAIFAESYNSKEGWPEQLNDLHQPLTYFCPQRALFITRNEWSQDALQFYVHAQAVYSAHPRFGRGHFLLYGLGRPWTFYARIADSGGVLGSAGDPQHYSVVLIDDTGNGFENSIMRDYADGPLASFVAVNNAPSFNWEAAPRLKPGQCPGPNWICSSDRRYQDMIPLYHPSLDFPGLHRPLSEIADWRYIGIDPGRKSFFRPRYPVKYAWRTAGIVRGSHAYALVMDDIRKDDLSHTYKWQMTLQPDLVLDSQKGNDLVLAETGGDRRLLVRFLQIEGAEPQFAYVERYAGYGWPERDYERNHGYRLVVPCRSVEPKFKVILYPFHKGEPLPDVEVKGEGFRVSWSDQTDQITFCQAPDGLNRMSINRDGQQIVTINQPTQSR